MADRLTQLQDCLDQLLVQMYASLHYIDTHHSAKSIPGQVDQFTPVQDLVPATQTTAVGTQPTQQLGTQLGTQASPMTAQGTQATQATQATQDADAAPEQPPSSQYPRPDPPNLFDQRMTELAQDLVLKEQQIEVIISSLPGIGNSQKAQESRLRALNRELKQVEKERDEWVGEYQALRGKVDGWIGEGVRRV
jgi:mediator of RNA polymerase II transcription subunit 21